MSRTYRRKGFEDSKRSSWNNRGRRQAGFYNTEVVLMEYDYVSPYTGKTYQHQLVDYMSFVPLSDQEFYKEYWNIHGDKCGWKDRHTSKWIRKVLEKELRQHSRQQIHKFVRNDDYEVVISKVDRKSGWYYY